MLRVEFKIDGENEIVAKVCRELDMMFLRREIAHSELQNIGERIYIGTGNKEEYGRFWAVFFELKKTSWIVQHIKVATWYSDRLPSNLLNDFLK